MKTKYKFVSLIFAAAALATLAPFARADETETVTHAKVVATTQDAATVMPGDMMMMVCPGCKTVDINKFKMGMAKSNPGHWTTIGSTHTCDHCGGTMTVVAGKTTDSMQHNCSVCGEGSAYCATMASMPAMK